MEHYFDEQFQFFTQFDVKAKGKPQKVKKWLLSREYLQPLTEPEDEECSPYDEYTKGCKNRLKCAYDAARYGMKEGVLTGIFLGGCWGIFKNLGDNFPFGFFGFDNMNDQQKTQRRKFDDRSQNFTGRTGKNSTKTQNSLKSSTAYGENVSTYNKNASAEHGTYTEKHPYSTNNSQMVYNVVNSKLPIRNDNRLLRAAGAGLLDNSNFTYQKNTEKVQIVGYAFIQTRGSITDSSSSDSSGQRQTEQVDETNKRMTLSRTKSQVSGNRLQKQTDNDSTNNSDATASVSSTPKNSVRIRIRDSSEIKSSSDSINSQSSVRKIEHKSKLSNVAEENGNDLLGQKDGKFKSNINMKKKQSDTNDFQLPEEQLESEVILQSSTNNWDNAESLSNTFSRKNTSLVSSASTRKSSIKSNSISKGKQSRKSSKKGSRDFVDMGRRKTEAENIYPDSKKLSSVLVDIDAVSNGFTSPQDITPREISPSERSSYIRYTDGQQIVPWPAVKTSTEKDKSDLKTLRFTSSDTSHSVDVIDIEGSGTYSVETSPKLRSVVSVNKEGEEIVNVSCNEDLTYGNDCQSRRHLLEENSVQKRTNGSISYDATPQRSSIRSYISGLQTPDSDGNKSPYFKYSEKSSRERLSHLSNFEEMPAMDNSQQKIQTTANSSSFLNDEPKSIDKIAESSHSRQKKDIDETSVNHKFQMNESLATIGSYSSHDKSDITEMGESKRCSVENSLCNKFSAEDRYADNVKNQTAERDEISNQQVIDRYYVEDSQEKHSPSAYSYQSQEGRSVSAGSHTHRKSQAQEERPPSVRQSNYDKIQILEERSQSSDLSAYDKSRRNSVTVDKSVSGSPRYTKSYDSHSQSADESRKQFTIEEMDTRSVRLSATGALGSVYEQEYPLEQQQAVAKSDHSASEFLKSGHTYQKTSTKSNADDISDAVVKGVGLVGETSQGKKAQRKKTSLVQKKDDPTEKKKSSLGLNFLTSLNENLIILSACNCAIVLGVLCSVISTTRASLAM